jgi:hypothetical protein
MKKVFQKICVAKRILVLLDWKTSSAIWDEYELQTAAYRQAILEKSAKKLPIKRFDGLWTGVVRLGTNHKSGYEMRVWDEEQSEINFRLFCASYDIYRRKAGDEFSPEIEHIPAEIQLAIPKVTIPSLKRKPRRAKGMGKSNS